MCEKPTVLIISGLDPTGGAGIAKDIITVSENGCHPLSLISSLTVQNSIEFISTKPINVKYLKAALTALKKEFTFNAIKIGLIPHEPEWIKFLARLLDQFQCPVVIDPVIKASSQKNSEISVVPGFNSLLNSKNRIITPNFKELRAIYRSYTDKKGTGTETMARIIVENSGCSVVTTFEGKKDHIMITTLNGESIEKIRVINTDKELHGTGCTFS